MTVHVSVLVSVSNVPSISPLAGLLLAGTSPAPVRVAWIGIMSAKACELDAINAMRASAALNRPASRPPPLAGNALVVGAH